MNEAESAGEHPSDGELKDIILAKKHAETPALMRPEPSNEKVQSWWTKLTGLPGAGAIFRSEMPLKSALRVIFPSVAKTMVCGD